jgi:hypothetical protein
VLRGAHRRSAHIQAVGKLPLRAARVKGSRYRGWPTGGGGTRASPPEACLNPSRPAGRWHTYLADLRASHAIDARTPPGESHNLDACPEDLRVSDDHSCRSARSFKPTSVRLIGSAGLATGPATLNSNSSATTSSLRRLSSAPMPVGGSASRVHRPPAATGRQYHPRTLVTRVADAQSCRRARLRLYAWSCAQRHA